MSTACRRVLAAMTTIASVAAVGFTVASGETAAATGPARADTSLSIRAAAHDGGHRSPTTLSIRVAHRFVPAHGATAIHGRLRTRHVGIPHRVVLLLARTAEHPEWQVTDRDRSDRHGRVAYRVSPPGKTAYRLVFLGTRMFQPARSPVVRVGVRPEVSISASPRRIDPGESTLVTGVVTLEGEPVAGALVDLRARPAHRRGFRVVGAGTTDTNGLVTITHAPDLTTVYRLVVRGAPDRPRGVSGPERVFVRHATGLAILGRDTSDGYAVTGVLLSRGSPVRGARVTLLAQPPGSTEWTAVDTKRTKRHGRVRFEQPSAPETGYRLWFAGNRWFAPSLSGTVLD